MHAARTNKAGLTKACLVAMGLVVVALMMGAQPASGRQGAVGQYSITDLGTLPGGGFSVAYGINSRGQVVGYGDTDSGGAARRLVEQVGRLSVSAEGRPP